MTTIKTKRLIGNVTPDVHTKMKIEAAKADLSMNDVFTMAVMEAFNIDLLTSIPPYSAPNLLCPTALNSNPRVVFNSMNAIIKTSITDITIPQLTFVAGPTKSVNQSIPILAESCILTDASLFSLANHVFFIIKLLK